MLYVFGGHDGAVYRNDLLVFNLETRTWILDLDVTGEGPSPRDAHAAVLHGEYMYVFGGYDSKRYLNDFHKLHFEDSEWSSVVAAGGAPSPRGGHTAVAVHDRQGAAVRAELRVDVVGRRSGNLAGDGGVGRCARKAPAGRMGSLEAPA